jgi:hypothetical protein
MEIVDRFRITPEESVLETLSPLEIEGLFQESQNGSHTVLERCTLAVLNCGSENDDVKAMMERYRDFRVEVIRTAGGIQLEILNAPASAFVTYESLENGRVLVKHKMIEGIRHHILAVLRDLVFIRSEIERTGKFDLKTSEGITDAVFQILRNARIFDKKGRHKVVVCWGGHAIPKEEYDYTVAVGNECGLRLMDIITGCGSGAMRGPMEGATIAHAKQRIKNGRYIGISEPGIIASEPPNPIVDPLVIMPDVEKRLEAFVRLAHGIVIFPGGAGTIEEIMYILGLLCDPKNRDIPFPLIFTGPASSGAYFTRLQQFLAKTFSEGVRLRYRLILDDPARVALELNKGLLEVKAFREAANDSYYFHRNLHVDDDFQAPFVPTHENARTITVTRDQDLQKFAATLRRVFSMVVSGNVKPEGIRAVEKNGPFVIRGDRNVMQEIDAFLRYLVDEGRMRLVGTYKPCYTIAA